MLIDVFDDSLFQVIQRIREAPTYYIGGRSLCALLSFISGYQLGEGYYSDETICHRWYKEFEKFLLAYCRSTFVPENHFEGINVIYEIEPDDALAYDRFYTLLDLFIKQHKNRANQDGVLKSRPTNKLKSFRLGMITISQALNAGLQDNAKALLGVEDDLSDYDYLMEWENDFQHLRLVMFQRCELEKAKKLIHEPILFINGSEDGTIPPCQKIP